MCGIVGMMTFADDARRWREPMTRAIALMARRGPDAAGLWADDACTLGFRRLSILDLSESGNQPMLTRDGRYALVFNGELYNFREIRSRLEARGVQLRSTGDTEVVLYALAEFGAAALDSFNGMFALAFYDATAKRLLLARDHAAIKPLYVLRHPDGLLFASQYDQILTHPWSRGRSLDPGALGLYLTLGHVPAPWALLEGSGAIEAGAWLSVDRHGTYVSGRHFTLPQWGEADLRGEQAVEAVDAAVTNAVRRQMVSDVPVGVFLSGGIDSPLVAAAMTADATAPIPAFSIGSDGPQDETADARRYAQALGVRHVVERVTSREVLGMLDSVVTACTEPTGDFSIFPTALVSRVARRQVTVALSGDGGDDILWGYPGRMIGPLRIAEGRIDTWRSRLAQTLGGAPPRARRTHVDEHTLRRIASSTLGRNRFVPLAQLEAACPSRPPIPQDFTAYTFEGRTLDEFAQWLRWNEYTQHLARVLLKVDRASMHHSLEVRVPLLDREVVETAARVDWRSAVDMDHEIGKLPLRRALERRVGFQTARKRGFDIPMDAWLRGPLSEQLHDLVISRQDIAGLPVSHAALTRIAQRHRLHLESGKWLLWRLLSLALWEAHHLKPAGHTAHIAAPPMLMAGHATA